MVRVKKGKFIVIYDKTATFKGGDVIKGKVKAKVFKNMSEANKFIKKLKKEFRPYTVFPIKNGVAVEYV